MANWKYTLDFSNFWDDETITVEEKGRRIAKLISSKFYSKLDCANLDYYDGELDEIYEGFNNILDMIILHQLKNLMNGCLPYMNGLIRKLNHLANILVMQCAGLKHESSSS